MILLYVTIQCMAVDCLEMSVHVNIKMLKIIKLILYYYSLCYYISRLLLFFFHAKHLEMLSIASKITVKVRYDFMCLHVH